MRWIRGLWRRMRTHYINVIIGAIGSIIAALAIFLYVSVRATVVTRIVLVLGLLKGIPDLLLSLSVLLVLLIVYGIILSFLLLPRGNRTCLLVWSQRRGALEPFIVAGIALFPTMVWLMKGGVFQAVDFTTVFLIDCAVTVLLIPLALWPLAKANDVAVTANQCRYVLYEGVS